METQNIITESFYSAFEIIYLIITGLFFIGGLIVILRNKLPHFNNGSFDNYVNVHPNSTLEILWKGKSINNLYKLPFFTLSPYITVLKIIASIVIAMACSLLVFLMIGGIVWGLFWMCKIILWIVIVIGWIMFVGGIVCFCFGKKIKVNGVVMNDIIVGVVEFILMKLHIKLIKIQGAIICLIISTLGGFIVYQWKESLIDCGNIIVDAGNRFFDNMNMFSFIKTLTVNYWDVALIIIATPIAILFACIMLTFMIAGLLMLIENIVMKRFNIKNPCPICQKPSEPAIYLYEDINGISCELPVKLQPGKYGLLQIKPTNMSDGYKLPTMFFNGKDKLVRRCPHCGNYITALTGTEKHIGIVGVSNSGKTTLLYRMIGVLCKEYGESISFTDVKAHDSGLKEAIEKINSMSLLTELKTSDDYPLKTSKQRLRSIQLIANRQNSKMPYHLYFNDIAGESFSITGEGNVDFIKNVQSIIFVIDPETTDFSDIEIGKDFAKWLKKQTKHNYGKVALREMFDILLRELINVRKEDVKNIILNVVLIKTDLGYYNFGNNTNEASIKSFIKNEMGQHDIIYGIDNNFDVNKIHYHAVSAASLDDYSNLTNFTNNIMKQLAVNIK